MTRLNEPARTKLFWLPIYKVVLGAIKDVIVNLWESCVDFVSIRNKALWIVVFPFLIVVYPLLVVTCVLIFIGSSLVTIGNYIVGGVVYAIDTIYLRLKSVSVICPQCQNKYVVPTFICPTCGAEHRSLRPGRYGIFHRICSCGAKIPSTCLTGRHKLSSKCPHCGKMYSGSSFTHDISIPVIGGVNAGKTCYIHMAIQQLENVASSYGLDFKSDLCNDEDYAFDADRMSKGYAPLITCDLRLRYYQFCLTEQGAKVQNLVSLGDVAGRVFTGTKNLSDQIGFKNAKQILFVLDPLAISDFVEEIAAERNMPETISTTQDIGDILNSLIVILEAYANKRSNQMLNYDVAVVISKCDIPEVQREVGSQAVSDAMNDESLGLKTELDALNYVCEQFLKKYNESNFLQHLKSKFATVQFFVCSALGHEANNTKFTPTKVEDPILWLVDRESAKIDLKEKWHKSV